jgi:RimJ/RimL family protein N-acetyltransferase
VKAPDRLETARLLLRRPRPADARAILERYASDLEVTRYVAWPAHLTDADSARFIRFSDSEWDRWPAGPYLIVDRAAGRLLGSTGLAFDTPHEAMTGYVLARDAWGRGYATEALRAMVALAPGLGVTRLSAVCHVEHRVSARVLEKGGFVLQGTLPRYANFPNLSPGVPSDVLCYAIEFQRTARTAG